MKPEDNYAPWVDEIFVMPTEKRVAKMEEVLSSIASLGDEAEKNIRAFTDKKEFEKLSFLGYLHLTDMGSATPEKSGHLKFPKPVIAAKHTKLPLILGITEKLPSELKTVDIEDARLSMGVNQLLDYTKTLSRMNPARKKELYKLCIEGIRSYREKNSQGDVWLSDFLESNKDFELKGFCLNLPYINVDPKYGDTKSFWIHPWGTPQLLFTHKRLPIIMIVGPSVRLDQNVLGERNMTGYTG